MGSIGGGGDIDTRIPEPKRTYRGVSFPDFVRPRSADAFVDLEVVDDDVIVSSLVKGGTTWTHNILYNLLHGYDDEGNVLTPTTEKLNSRRPLGSSGQVYMEALPYDRAEYDLAVAAFRRQEQAEAEAEVGKSATEEEAAPPAEQEEEGAAAEVKPYNPKFFGPWTVQDMIAQPSPRVFSTHMFGRRLLPQQLVQGGKGKLIVVLRNLKDVLVSLHYFRGEPKDGWTGNEFGPGTFARFTAVDRCPNAFGCPFTWIKETNEAKVFMEEQGFGRNVLVVYFEELKMDLPAQLDRINTFLDRPPLTESKRTAVAEACGFKRMQGDGIINQNLFRKGSIGDWRNHLSQEHWEQFDSVFDDVLNDCPIADPLRQHQTWKDDDIM